MRLWSVILPQGGDQYVVPYLMSSHPGCSMQSAVELAEYVRDLGYMPEQVQDFYPTPSTLSTCMYYTGVDPRTMQKVYVPKSPHEKAMQRALIQYRDPKNRDLVREALERCGRRDRDRKIEHIFAVAQSGDKRKHQQRRKDQQHHAEYPRNHSVIHSVYLSTIPSMVLSLPALDTIIA